MNAGICEWLLGRRYRAGDVDDGRGGHITAADAATRWYHIDGIESTVIVYVDFIAEVHVEITCEIR